MNERITIRIGVVLAGLGVAIGAFGAHALRPVLEQNARTDTFELAVRYQFYHAFAIIFSGILMHLFKAGHKHIRRAVVCFFTGIIFFSGSLYTLALSGIKILGAVTPVGGLLFLAGWLLLFTAMNTKGPD